MKVLLVPPTFHYKDAYPALLSISDFPSGFAYIAAGLKKAGHEVIGLNPNNIAGYASAKLMLADILSKKVKESNPDVIGLGGLCTDYAFLRDAIAIIRGVDPNIPIVLGGQIVTNDAEFIYDDLQPDYAIIGEADEAFVDLVGDIKKGIPKGILRANIIKDLDSLPFPDYEPFGGKAMVDDYSMATRLLYRYSRPYPRPFNIVASRSCPFSCSFCVHGRRDIPYRARSIGNIMAEIKESYENYHFNILIILDELFAVNKQRMTDFCNGIFEGKKKYGWDFDWMFQTHASAKLDLKSLVMAKQAGCFFFSYGLESASPTVLKSMKKKIKPEQVVEAIDLARQAKVGFGANLIFGDPAETQETWAESLAFWMKHGQDNFIFLATLMPYPGSQVFEGRVRDKRKFYEHIDEGATNLTTIPRTTMEGLSRLNQFLESEWLFPKIATKVRCEAESLVMYKIWATCPHCGEESMYRMEWGDRSKPLMLGTGCTKCNRRMRVEVPC